LPPAEDIDTTRRRHKLVVAAKARMESLGSLGLSGHRNARSIEGRQNTQVGRSTR
jgi:hypothetical protein